MGNIRLERNYGCRLEDQWTYKGMRAIVMQNEKLRITLLPDKGSDIIEMVYKPLDLDFLYRSRLGIQNPVSFATVRPGLENAFLDHYSGGWQEVFPAGSGGCQYKGAHYGLHGEVFLQAWDSEILCDSPEEVAIRLSVRTLRSPYLLQKEIRLLRNDSSIRFREFVTNEGAVPLEFMWGHHPAFGEPFIGPHTRLELSDCTIVTHPVAYSKNQRFPANSNFSWPYAVDVSEKLVNLQDLLKDTQPTSDMLYATKLKEGRASLINEERGVGIALVWDLKMFPYLWIWYEAGGTQEYPWYGSAKVLGLEPFTSLPGTGEAALLQAIENNTAVRIQPGETLSTEFAVQILKRNRKRGTHFRLKPRGS